MRNRAKKLLVLSLAMVMAILLVACGGQKAFDTSKVAYEKVDTAYKITEEMASDMYEAWRMGIYDDDKISVEYLASELNISEAELTEGIVYALYSLSPETTYEEASEEDKEVLRESADYYFLLFEDDLFSACVEAVIGAYTVNGKVEEAQVALDEAKGYMKELSDKYSDYEHYPNLKGYYTTTSSFFDFCQNPSGSFEQVKDTINDYKNEARDYSSDLDYIFE